MGKSSGNRTLNSENQAKIGKNSLQLQKVHATKKKATVMRGEENKNVENAGLTGVAYNDLVRALTLKSLLGQWPMSDKANVSKETEKPVPAGETAPLPATTPVEIVPPTDTSCDFPVAVPLFTRPRIENRVNSVGFPLTHSPRIVQRVKCDDVSFLDAFVVRPPRDADGTSEGEKDDVRGRQPSSKPSDDEAVDAHRENTRVEMLDKLESEKEHVEPPSTLGQSCPAVSEELRDVDREEGEEEVKKEEIEDEVDDPLADEMKGEYKEETLTFPGYQFQPKR